MKTIKIIIDKKEIEIKIGAEYLLQNEIEYRFTFQDYSCF